MDPRLCLVSQLLENLISALFHLVFFFHLRNTLPHTVLAGYTGRRPLSKLLCTLLLVLLRQVDYQVQTRLTSLRAGQFTGEL